MTNQYETEPTRWSGSGTGSGQAASGNLSSNMSRLERALAEKKRKKAEAAAKGHQYPGVGTPSGAPPAEEVTKVADKVASSQQAVEDQEAKYLAAETAARENGQAFLASANPEERERLRENQPFLDAEVETERKQLIVTGKVRDAAVEDAKSKGLSRENLEAGAKYVGAAALIYSALAKDDPPAAQSAGETYRELSDVAADTGVQANRQIAEYAGKYGITDLLNNEQLRAAFEQSGQSDFGAWLRSELASGSAAGQVINDLTNPFALEQRGRGDRLTEAKHFYDTYDASSFMSPEQTSALAYATQLQDDPLDVQLRGYIGDELKGEYSPEYYRELRQDLFGNLDKSMQATTHGLGQALLGTEAAKRQRQQQGASMAHQFVGRKQAYQPQLFEMSRGADPLAISNVGRMPVGSIQPMDPTGPFFSSFPAMEQQTQLAGWQGRKTLADKTTALEAAIDKLVGLGS